MQEQTSVLGFFVGAQKSCKLVAKKYAFFWYILAGFDGVVFGCRYFRFTLGFDSTKVAGQTEAVVTRWGWLVPTAESYVLRPPSLFDKKEGEIFKEKKWCPGWKMNRIFWRGIFFKTPWKFEPEVWI